VVGALLGTAVAGVYAAVLLAFPRLVASTVAIGCGVLLTGAFHEDGLADTADALGGGWTRQEALRILKDPAHGTYGVLAVALSLLLRVGALTSLDRWSAVAVLPAAHALSRAVSIGLLGVARPATDGGLGAFYASLVSRRLVFGALAAGLFVGLVFLEVWALPAALLAGLGASVVGWLSVRKLGGVTGDVLGAAQQAAEVLVLLLGAALAANGLFVAWWR
jgi:adenosylcobinamide-GDP ribazoletransferase